MSEERKKRIKNIADQFDEEIIQLAGKTEKEIQQMLNDSISAFETIYHKKPDALHTLMYYDDLILRLIKNLLAIRDGTNRKLLHSQK